MDAPERTLVEVRLGALRSLGRLRPGGACVLCRCDACDTLWESCMADRQPREVSRQYAAENYSGVDLG